MTFEQKIMARAALEGLDALKQAMRSQNRHDVPKHMKALYAALL
jgi:hypothetical protein